MNNAETVSHLRKYVLTNHGTFSWPTDACGYDQHMLFVEHRNKCWRGGSAEQWRDFVLAYAESLVSKPEPNHEEIVAEAESELDGTSSVGICEAISGLVAK
jgi:hypothetical protein